MVVNMKEREAHLNAISLSTWAAIIMMDPDGMITFWNEAAERIFGYEAKEALGKNLHSLVAPERFHAAHHEAFAVFQYSGAGAAIGKTIELQGLHKDGHEIEVELSLSAFELADGWHAVGILRDITHRRLSEEAIRESYERLDQLAEHTRTMAWEVDLEGLYTYVSSMAKTLTGYEPEELTGKKHFYDLCPEDEREALKRNTFEGFRRRAILRDFENQVQKADGEIIWVSTNGFPVLNAEGELTGYRGSDTDITDRKKFEMELKRAHEQTRFIMDSIQAGIILVRCSDRIIIQANAAANHMIGAEENFLVGRVCNEHICPAAEDECPVLDLNQHVDNSERTIVRLDGSRIPVLKTVNRIEMGV